MTEPPFRADMAGDAVHPEITCAAVLIVEAALVYLILSSIIRASKMRTMRRWRRKRTREDRVGGREEGADAGRAGEEEDG